MLVKYDAYKKLEEFVMKSRKLRLLIAIIVMATAAAFLPPLACWLLAFYLKKPILPLVLLTDGDWITVISIIVPAYIGALTWEKQIAMSNNVHPRELDQKIAEIKNNMPATSLTAAPTNDDAAERQKMKDALTHDK